MTHILVIDNDLYGRMQLTDILLSIDSETTVASAAHGYKSLELYIEHHPDLVIAEIRKQEIEGFDTILNLRKLDRELPVLLTSHGLPVRLVSETTLNPCPTAPSATSKCGLLSAVRTCLSNSNPPTPSARAA